MKRNIIKLAAVFAALLISLLAAAGCSSEEKDSTFAQTIGSLDEIIEKIEEKGAFAAVVSVYEADDKDGSVYLNTTIANIKEGDWVTVAVNDLSIKEKIEDQTLAARHFTLDTFDEIADEADDASLLEAFYSEVDGYMYLTPNINANELENLAKVIKDSGFTEEDLFEEYLKTRFVPTLESNIVAKVLDEKNCEYSVNSDGSIKITKIDAEIGNIVIPDTIDSKPVTEISCEAIPYNAYERLYSVTVGKNVKRINSFGGGCVTLLDINTSDNSMFIAAAAINESRYCIEDENGIVSLGNIMTGYTGSKIDFTIPDDILYIADHAFANNNTIKSITAHKNLISIANNAFSKCTSLESCDFSATKTLLDNGVFSGCSSLKEMTIPDGNTIIGDDTFSGCESLKNVTIPKSIETISMKAFSFNYAYDGGYAESLEGLYIEDLEAFCKINFEINPLIYANNLYLNGELVTDLIIPESITEIKNNAFTGASIKSVTIHDSVNSIGDRAFNNCLSLNAVNGANSVEFFGNNTFTLTPWLENSAKSAEGGMVIIGRGVLLHCAGEQKNVIIPDSVKSICSTAFSDSDDSDIESVTIGAGVAELKNISFGNSLVKLVIPATVTEIENLIVPTHVEGDKDFGIEYVEGTTIYCAPGSAAEEYAKTNDIPFEYIG